MDFSIIASPRAQHQVTHQGHLQDGLAAHGIKAVLLNSVDQVKTPYVACWGWRLGKQLRERGHEVLVMERGYVGDRFKYTSLGWNGLNGHATFPEYPDDGGERFDRHGGVLNPWKQGGEYALILGQVPKDMSLQGRDMMPWYERMAIEIQQQHNIGVKFRPHPDLKKRGIVQSVRNTYQSESSLQDDLAGAAFTLCFNSNSAVDSVLAGIPCVVGDNGTMAYDMCAKDIHNPVRPDRELWAHRLAWKQWELSEIKSGAALEGILK